MPLVFNNWALIYKCVSLKIASWNLQSEILKCSSENLLPDIAHARNDGNYRNQMWKNSWKLLSESHSIDIERLSIIMEISVWNCLFCYLNKELPFWNGINKLQFELTQYKYWNSLHGTFLGSCCMKRRDLNISLLNLAVWNYKEIMQKFKYPCWMLQSEIAKPRDLNILIESCCLKLHNPEF